jgi:hypothetical protein
MAMRHKEILEASKPKQKDAVYELIKAAGKKVGFDGLSGGNCGTLAIALANYLSDTVKQDVGFLILTGDDTMTQEELQHGDYDLEHVMLHTLKNGKHVFYDAAGCVPYAKVGDYLLAFHKRCYGGPLKEFFLDHEPMSEMIIRTNTDWNISSDAFYNFFKEIENPNETV